MGGDGGDGVSVLEEDVGGGGGEEVEEVEGGGEGVAFGVDWGGGGVGIEKVPLMVLGVGMYEVRV